MSITAQQMINDALCDIGVQRFGQSASADISMGSLRVLNQMLDSWLLDELMVFADTADIYPMTAGKQQYKIGPAGPDIVAPRPTRISDANIVLNTFSPVVRRPVQIINVDQWANIGVQGIPYAIPIVLYYDGNFDAGSGYATINVWPGPLSSYGLELFTWKQIQQFSDLATTYRFPPGYELAIRKSLAVSLIPTLKPYMQFAADLSVVQAEAARSKTAIQAYNAPDPVLAGDPAYQSSNTTGGWNYSLGEYGRSNR